MAISNDEPTHSTPQPDRPAVKPEPGKPDAPVSVQQAAERPPTRHGGADAGQTADDPGRGGD